MNEVGDLVPSHVTLSPEEDAKLFNTHVGMTFLEHLHQLRVSHAAGLLLNTDLRMSEVAFSVGFESLRTFSRVFREIKGMSPGEFKKTVRPLRKDYLFHSAER